MPWTEVRWRSAMILKVNESTLDQMNEQFCRVLFKLSRIDVDIELTEKKGEVIYHSN